MKPNISVVNQGKTIVEKDDDGFLVLFPDGEVCGASTKKKAETIIRRWYKRNLGAQGCKLGIGEIEWRESRWRE